MNNDAFQRILVIVLLMIAATPLTLLYGLALMGAYPRCGTWLMWITGLADVCVR